MRRVLALVLLPSLFVVLPSPSVAQEPPLGVVAVGTDPAIAETVEAGAEGWTATGVVRFVVEATGCGTGDLTFCLETPHTPGAIAGWDYALGDLVRVNPATLDRFTPATACHEFAHYLGLRWFSDGSIYHRTDYLSCTSDPYPTVPCPDEIDLANLGFPDAPTPCGPFDSPAEPRVVALPNTGTGSAFPRK